MILYVYGGLELECGLPKVGVLSINSQHQITSGKPVLAIFENSAF